MSEATSEKASEKANEKGAENIRVVENATCTFCGCVCDDMVLTVDLDTGKITKAKNACVLGKAWFLEHTEEGRPLAVVDGKEVALEEAVEEAAQILANARLPLIFGFGSTTCETQRVAVAIADLIKGTIDCCTSVCHGPSGIAFQGVGESTATLGETMNRADLVVFWGCNPAEAHPRHTTRYAVTAKGMYTPNRKKDRTVVLIEVRRTPSAVTADLFIQVKPGSDFEVLWALRALVKGRPVDPAIEKRCGVPLSTLEDLAERMKSCRFGVLFFGMGLTMTRGRHFNTGALLALATDLNEHTHFVVNAMRGHGNVTGADNVLSWQTGYPFGVNFSRGYPRFNPGEFTATDLLARDGADAALIVGGDPISNFSRAAIERLRRIPLIVLDPKRSMTTEIARVAITTATYGINTAGTVYRLDGVPITLRPVMDSPYPSDEEVLTMIKNRARELVAGRRAVEGAGTTHVSSFLPA
jgi:formylmethanofuran dehydrogenase subunit B